MDAFLSMGGYAAYVWPAYALTAAVLALVAVASRRQLAGLERELAALEAGQDAPP